MLLLAVDPGETLGYVLIELGEGTPKVEVAAQVQLPIDNGDFDWEAVSKIVQDLYLKQEPDALVLEDYRVYRDKAMAHTGSRVLTANLIGALMHEAALNMTPAIRISASEKGRWPEARLKKKYPGYFSTFVPKPHAGDALILALCFAESKGWWKP